MMRNDLSRRQLLTTCGAYALWRSLPPTAAERTQAATDEIESDTIQKVELFRIKTIRRSEKTPFIWLRITTKNGVVGFGECYAVESTEKWLAPYMKSLEGRNVTGLINKFYQSALPDLERSAPYRTKMGWGGAVAALEIALWDILGKTVGRPVHSFLGGAVRDKVPLYANHAIFHGDGPPPHERIRKAKELGFDMFKWDPFKGKPKDEKTIAKQIEPVERAREALGDDFKLAIDAHARWPDINGPRIAARLLEPLKIEFFEEPFAHNKLQRHRELADATKIPLASGEHMSHHEEVTDLLGTRSVKYFQPDVGNIGGIAAMRNACHVAACFGSEVSTHNWCGPLSTLATLQVTAVIPNLYRQEWPHLAYGESWETEIIEPRMTVENGHVKVPQEPGIGAVPNLDLLKRMDRIL